LAGLNPPPLQRNEIANLALRAGPLTTANVDGYGDRLPFANAIQKIYFVLGEFNGDRLGVLFVGVYYQFAFAKRSRNVLDREEAFYRASYFHGNLILR
jgi:hypothetical protein